MVYFFFNLMVHLFISALFAFAVVYFHRAYRRQTIKKGIVILFPFLFSILFLVHFAWISTPRMIDSIDIIRARYEQSELVVEDVGLINATLRIDGETYYYNPFAYKPKPGDVLQIEHTTHARYIVSMKKIGGET